MGLHELRPARGARTPKRRVGRGWSGRRGRTAGRGMKGQNARDNVHPLFEGGQLPLIKRLPHMRGFHNRFRTDYQGINVDDLSRFDAESEVSPATLVEAGIVKRPHKPVKILGDGDLDKPLKVSADGFSKSAKAKIEAAGGTATVIASRGNEAKA